MKRSQALALATIGGALTVLALRNKEQYDFHNKVVLITGGSRGLGLVLARQLGEQGARVAIIGRDGVTLADAERDLRERGVDVLAFPADVRSQSEATNAVERVVNHFGRIDVLVNNAGVIAVSPFDHLTVEDFENAIATHTYGPLYTMLAAIPHMRASGGGRIANISSIGGRVAVPHMVPYSTSKFALIGLSDGMRAELAGDNIKVSTICPGLMRAGSHYNALFKGNHEAEFAWFSIFDSLPGLSISVERAAASIITAISRGAPHLTISAPAKIAGAINSVAPGAVAAGTALFNSLLPGYAGPQGDELKAGSESGSPASPSILTTLSDQAAARNNELGRAVNE